MSLKESNHYKYQRKIEMVSNMIPTGMPTRRMLSQPLFLEEENTTSTFKAHNLPESQLATSKNMGSLLNSGLIYKLKSSSS